MRALLALLVVLAATVTVTACSGPGPAGNRRPRAAPLASPQTVGCDQIIQQAGPPGGRLVLGVLAAPPARLKQAAPTATRPWAYFAKYGIAIRAGIGWGNNTGVVGSLRLLSCPRQLGAWNAYAGGFYLRSPSGCVPLVFHIGRQTATLSFAIGNGSCGPATR